MSNVSAIILSCMSGIILGWFIAGDLFFRAAGVYSSLHKGFFHTLLQLFFWPKLLVIHVRNIREVIRLEKNVEDR